MAKKRRFTALVVLFVAIFALWWGISVLSESSAPISSVESVFAQGNGSLVAYPANTSIVVSHSLKNGVNAYSGEIMLPSQCDTLGTGISAGQSYTMHVTLILSLTADTQCAEMPQTPAEQPFSASVTLPSGASAPIFDGVTVNGIIVPSSLAEAK